MDTTRPIFREILSHIIPSCDAVPQTVMRYIIANTDANVINYVIKTNDIFALRWVKKREITIAPLIWAVTLGRLEFLIIMGNTYKPISDREGFSIRTQEHLHLVIWATVHMNNYACARHILRWSFNTQSIQFAEFAHFNDIRVEYKNSPQPSNLYNGKKTHST
jgi:hypothetical protein